DPGDAWRGGHDGGSRRLAQCYGHRPDRATALPRSAPSPPRRGAAVAGPRVGSVRPPPTSPDDPDASKSFADELDQGALRAPAVELAVEDPLPRAEIQPAAGDGDHHLPTHDLTLEVGVGVVFPGVVVAVSGRRFVRRERFEPLLV